TSRNFFELRVKAAAEQDAVEVLNDALGIPLRDRCRVGVGGVEQELDGYGPSALQVAGEFLGDGDAVVDIATANGVAEFRGGIVVVLDDEAFALAELRNKLARNR